MTEGVEAHEAGRGHESTVADWHDMVLLTQLYVIGDRAYEFMPTSDNAPLALQPPRELGEHCRETGWPLGPLHR
jgi:hypothetical protein